MQFRHLDSPEQGKMLQISQIDARAQDFGDSLKSLRLTRGSLRIWKDFITLVATQEKTSGAIRSEKGKTYPIVSSYCSRTPLSTSTAVVSSRYGFHCPNVSIYSILTSLVSFKIAASRMFSEFSERPPPTNSHMMAQPARSYTLEHLDSHSVDKALANPYISEQTRGPFDLQLQQRPSELRYPLV